jgi:hypothetical protein
VHAYLGLTTDGAFALYVSPIPLNPVGTRLERGRRKKLPGNVYAQAQNPNDPEAAIAGLASLDRFCKGLEYGTATLDFASDELALLMKKEKDER